MFWKTDTLPCEGNPCKCIDNKLVDREIKLNKLFGVDIIKSPYFKNNHNLRSSDILFEYTEDEIIEHIKAKKDIMYFHYLSQKAKKNKLTLYKFQEELLKSSQKNRFNLVTNSHQSGMSYMLAIKALYSAFSKCDINILILTNIGEDGQRILGLLKDIYQTLPFFMKPGIRVWNKKDIRFDNGSRIMCNIPSKVGFGRGYQVVIVDNYAFMTMKDKTTIYQNLVPTLLAMSHSELFISSVCLDRLFHLGIGVII